MQEQRKNESLKYEPDTNLVIHFLYQKRIKQQDQQFKLLYEKLGKKNKEESLNAIRAKKLKDCNLFHQIKLIGGFYDKTIEDLKNQIKTQFLENYEIQLDMDEHVFVNRSLKSIVNQEDRYLNKNLLTTENTIGKTYCNFGFEDSIKIQICPKNVSLQIYFDIEQDDYTEKALPLSVVPINSYFDHILFYQTDLVQEYIFKGYLSGNQKFFNVFGEWESVKALMDKKMVVKNISQITDNEQIWLNICNKEIHFQILNLPVDFHSTIKLRMKIRTPQSPQQYWRQIRNATSNAGVAFFDHIIPERPKFLENCQNFMDLLSIPRWY